MRALAITFILLLITTQADHLPDWGLTTLTITLTIWTALGIYLLTRKGR